MIKNQRGFVYPFIIILAGAVLSLTLFSIEGFISDKQFYKEAEEKIILDHLIKLATKDTERLLGILETAEEKEGIFFYQSGDVYYDVTVINPGIVKVILYASTLTERKATGNYLYDMSKKKMVKWL
jgi:hypothetical protein